MLYQPANMPFKAFKATIYISKVFLIKFSAKKANFLKLLSSNLWILGKTFVTV